MEYLVEEVRNWDTPAFGAYMLWRFTCGYCSAHPNGDAPIGLLHFVASAILTNNKLLETISNRRDGLQSYVRGFEDASNSDLLLGIHDRTKDRLSYTMAAIDIAIGEGLLAWDYESGKVYPRNLDEKNVPSKLLGTVNDRFGKKAEILGKWFSKHDCSTIAAYLKVVF